MTVKTKKNQKRAPRLNKRMPYTQLEKLEVAVQLQIDGPLGDLIKAARDSTALRERGRHRGKGRVQ